MPYSREIKHGDPYIATPDGLMHPEDMARLKNDMDAEYGGRGGHYFNPRTNTLEQNGRVVQRVHIFSEF